MRNILAQSLLTLWENYAMRQTHTRTLWKNVFFSYFFLTLKCYSSTLSPWALLYPCSSLRYTVCFNYITISKFCFLSLLPYSPSLRSLRKTFEKGSYTQKYIHSNSTTLSSFYAWVEIFTLGTKPVVDEILNTLLWANTITSTCTQKKPHNFTYEFSWYSYKIW